MDPSAYDYVLEVYDLTSACRSTHLEDFLERHLGGDSRLRPRVVWVDEQHALLVCAGMAAGGCGDMHRGGGYDVGVGGRGGTRMLMMWG